MADYKFSNEIKAFLSEHIHSISQLEVLLLLQGDPNREWSPAEVGAELRTSGNSASQLLDDLTARGFLVVLKREATPYFRYSVKNEWLGKNVSELAAIYRTFRIQIIELIFSKPA